MKERPILFAPDMAAAVRDGTKTQTRRVVKPQPVLERGVWRWQPKKGCDINVEHLNPSLISKLCPYGGPGDRLWVREKFIDGWDAPDGDLQQYDEGGNELPQKVWYAADDNGKGFTWLGDDGELLHNIPWKSSAQMPRCASQTTLEVTDVRVQRAQEITVTDAMAEGIRKLSIYDPYYSTPESAQNIGNASHWRYYSRRVFGKRWDRLNASPKPSKRNPYTLAPEQCFVSYPWDDIRETRPKSGLPWYVVGNPWVWAPTFRRIDDG